MMYEEVGLVSDEFICTFNTRFFENREYSRGWLHFNDPREIFIYLFQHFNSRFPRHFIFASFQCLQCGECCNWDWRDVYREDIKKWIVESRYDILRHVSCSEYRDARRIVYCASRFLHYDFENPCQNCRGGDLVPLPYSGRCRFLKKVRNKPYYECKIHDTTPEDCSGYLCEKSLPVAHLNWINVEDLIQKIGLEQYQALIRTKE